MKAEFIAGGVRYLLIVARDSRRAIAAAAEDIRPDRTLWSKRKKRAALSHRTEATAKEIHAAGVRGSA